MHAVYMQTPLLRTPHYMHAYISIDFLNSVLYMWEMHLSHINSYDEKDIKLCEMSKQQDTINKYYRL